MPFSGNRLATAILGLLALTRGTLQAQRFLGEGGAIHADATDRARLEELAGGRLRDANLPAPNVSFDWVRPTVIVVSNSNLPGAGAPGQMWDGRGLNASVTTGVRGRFKLMGTSIWIDAIPTYTSSSNRPFQFFPGIEPLRSPFSSPFHAGRASADLPLRFGDRPLRTIDFGQSSITVRNSMLSVGVSTTNEWWGPALRNTLVLSDNAAGIPRAFVRTAHPLRSRAGLFEGRLFSGSLTESAFFDHDQGNDHRSASGVLLTFRPALDTNFTVGLSRLVIARSAGPVPTVRHAFDALSRWRPLLADADSLADGRSPQQSDQIASVFARWVFPESGLEAYGEVARAELPRSLREFVLAPRHSQGYTLGTQLVTPSGRGRAIRFQAELTYLEQSLVITGRQIPDFYTGRAATQGFTQRGQVLGAAIGPGGSEQFIGMDALDKDWQLGAFIGRTRTENDALYRQPNVTLAKHDVTIFSGARGSARLPWSDVMGSVRVSRRMNYLFQSDFYYGDPVFAEDIQNVTFTVALTPR